MAFHRAERDEQPGRDLGVAQVLAEQGENLGLPRGHHRVGQGARPPATRPHGRVCRKPVEAGARGIRGYYGCRGRPAPRTPSAGPDTGRARTRRETWDRQLFKARCGAASPDWADGLETRMSAFYAATLDALEPLSDRDSARRGLRRRAGA